jgi:hypothetical protein
MTLAWISPIVAQACVLVSATDVHQGLQRGSEGLGVYHRGYQWNYKDRCRGRRNYFRRLGMRLGGSPGACECIDSCGCERASLMIVDVLNGDKCESEELETHKAHIDGFLRGWFAPRA